MSNPDKKDSGAGPDSSNVQPISSQPKKFPWMLIMVVLIIAGVGFFVVKRRQGEKESKAGPGAAGKGASLPVPVLIGTVGQKNVPIYLEGLGTVQAFNTVTIRSRVDGQLQKLGFTDGQDVHQGDLIAQIDPAPFAAEVEQAEAKKAQDEAQFSNAKIILKRDADLLASKIVSQEVYDTQKALADQLEATVKADQAAVDSAKIQLAYATITAPINGRTGIRQVDAGNIIHASDTNGIVVVTQLRPVSMIFTLPEQSLKQIQNQKQMSGGEMKVVALDRDNNTTLDEGTLAVIDNQIDTTTGTIRLKATFPNADLHLWPGQFANARLLLTVHMNGVVVPASVIQRGPEGSYAFMVKEDMSVEMRPVKVTQIEREEALIAEGLKPGEKVVIDGQYKLQPGAKVKPAQSGKPEGESHASNPDAKKSGEHSGKGKGKKPSDKEEK